MVAPALLSLIEKAQDHWGKAALSGGNCGMLALAMTHALKDPSLRLGMAIEDIEATTARDILAAETDIYHVWIHDARQAYDGTGVMDLTASRQWIAEEYGDTDPHVVTGLDPFEPAVLSLIRNDTDWSISAGEFLSVLSPLTKPPRRPRGAR